jgi:hypothetical protein
VEVVEDERGPRWNDAPAFGVEEADRRQVADGPPDPVFLRGLRREADHLAHQLIERQGLRVQVENVSQDRRLVPGVFCGGGRAITASANRLVVQCQPSGPSGGGVRPERLVPRMAVG